VGINRQQGGHQPAAGVGINKQQGGHQQAALANFTATTFSI
jgi:hypothetical protein